MRRSLSATTAILLLSAGAFGQSKPLERAWEHEMKGQLPQAVIVDAKDPRYLYVACKSAGLVVLKCPEVGKTPAEVAKVSVDRLDRLDVMHLAQRGDLLYLALGDFFNAKGTPAGLAIVSVKDRGKPRVIGTWKSSESLHGSAHLVVDDRYVYLGAMTEGVMIFDVSNPARIQHVSTFQPEINYPRPKPNRVQHPNARGLAIVGDRLYVAYDAGGLRILDVSNRKSPREIGRYANAGMMRKQQAYNNVTVDGDLVYAAIDYAGCEVLNVKDPKNVRQVGWWNPWGGDRLDNLWFNSSGHANQIGFDRKRTLVYLSAGDSELQVLNVSDPKQPKLVGHVGSPKNGRGVSGATLAEPYVYLTYITAAIPFRSTWAGIVAVKTR